MNATIEIDGLRKRFGPVQALDGMTFTVHPGQVTASSGRTAPANQPPYASLSAWTPPTRAPPPSAAAIGLVLGVLYLFPIAADAISNPTLARHLDQIGPLPAGLDAQATIGVTGLPLTPWQGLGVVALWTAGALLLGVLVLKFRDA
jgi:hypothetical protein